MDRSKVLQVVNDVLKSVEFEKVSDLTKEQFAYILSISIYKTITSDSFIDHIDHNLLKDR